ncbi:MAG: formylmethanofuran dehydrogenase subunit E family protein [Pseudomonadota bacterium]
MVRLRSAYGKIALEDYLERVRSFHGLLAPGVLLGGFMVDWALEVMERSQLLDAVVETRKCLPDAVQILTKCSIGNGWLRILDWGILAVTLYDKKSFDGARVHLDLKKMEQFPLVKAWAMKEKPRGENPFEPLIEEMIRAGREMLSCQEIIVGAFPEGLSPYGQPKVCSGCGEAFRYGKDDRCPRCLEPYAEII